MSKYHSKLLMLFNVAFQMKCQYISYKHNLLCFTVYDACNNLSCKTKLVIMLKYHGFIQDQPSAILWRKQHDSHVYRGGYTVCPRFWMRTDTPGIPALRGPQWKSLFWRRMSSLVGLLFLSSPFLDFSPHQFFQLIPIKTKTENTMFFMHFKIIRLTI